MPVPFGFGVGDFIAVAKLLLDIQNALKENRGASDGYQSLMRQLNSLYKVMERLRLMVSSNQLSDIATCNAIREEVKICEDLMLQFLQATEKYRDSLNKGGSRNKVKDAWKKMSWGLFKKEDIQELRESLKVHTDCITMLMMTSTSTPEP